ncbi:hypothetical protein [Rhodococcus sp. USK13]|uniref:hypothetical protein n=1 Tax=Rhodococcus sp. USK13 TaxID=2806442 RepID=UPI002016BC4C|nr:hypothetical protein [Rhodococcus sp. USK13]
MSVGRPHLGISAAQDHYGQTRISGAPVDPGQPALSFEAFTGEVLAWVQWWNTEHSIGELGDRTPMQSWDGDPTPIHDADETRLWMFTLEDDRRNRKITTKGDAFGRNRYYIAEWMVGLVGAGVRIRLFRARPTPRDIRHTLVDALAIGGAPATGADRIRPAAQGRALRTISGAGLRRGAVDVAGMPRRPRMYPRRPPRIPRLQRRARKRGIRARSAPVGPASPRRVSRWCARRVPMAGTAGNQPTNPAARVIAP